MNQVVNLFINGHPSEATRRSYTQSLSDYASFCSSPDIASALEKLIALGEGGANSLAASYRLHLMDRGLSPATVNARMSALRALVKEARKFGHCDFLLDVDNLDGETMRDTSGPGFTAYRAMLDKVSERGDDPKSRRDRALLRLLHDMALRRNEVIGLDLEDIDLANAKAHVKGKGKLEKAAITIPTNTLKALEDWIASRGNEPGALFVNLDPTGKRNRLTGASLWRLVRQYGEDVGVKTRPHGLRHLAISRSLEHNDIRTVQKFSRHKNIQTVVIYDDRRNDAAGKVAESISNY